MSDLFLGLDLSTQQLKATIIGEQLEVVKEEFVHFDNELPEFHTRGGVIIDAEGKGEQRVTAPTLMWVKALDLLLQKLQRIDIPLEKIRAISGSGQQHGSVYWHKGAEAAFETMNPFKPLHEQFDAMLSITQSPVWMDSSTGKQCRKLEKAVGGPEVLASVTGSSAYERFTGPQIAAVYERHPETYENTERISLISSFMASLLLGRYAAIDWADGSGMNLLDIRRKHWDLNCLAACGPDLKRRLQQPCPSWTVLGKISRYFCERYGFTGNCDIVAFTGDNPASFAGMNLCAGDLCVSLGTSDTIFAVVNNPKPALEGHVMCSPVKEDEFMTMVCFKNGSLIREKVLAQCTDGTWPDFEQKLNATECGNNGKMGLYFDQIEIVPRAHGIHRFDSENKPLKKLRPEEEIRALVEFQSLAKRHHIEKLGFRVRPHTRIFVTGGGSKNTTLLQVIANVFQGDVYTQGMTNSAAYGAACRALHALKGGSYSDMIRSSIGFPKTTIAVRHDPKLKNVYDNLLVRYSKLIALVSNPDKKNGLSNGTHV
ncbi:hypothetical protein RvY_04770 [Ramazzottius varieornatus]|uniref:Xylulose kinase n=1 Tax=Ramazzottius varieornatus TaxID=947166 RepID=A0A1D1V1X2_RAMVA|nr:hypothetical protein RvY_04770 [Ramazzottius varieornatus]